MNRKAHQRHAISIPSQVTCDVSTNPVPVRPKIVSPLPAAVPEGAMLLKVGIGLFTVKAALLLSAPDS